MPKIQINLDGWQDYRGVVAGALLYVETSRQSIVPVRDQLNENEKGFFSEPNYETSTYGFITCCNAKAVNMIVKNKSRYILFGTRYEGASASDLKNKYVIMGYMRIDKTKDVRTRHIQKYMETPGAVEPECMQLEKNMAVYGPMRFVSLEDSYILTDEQLKEWGYKGRATRQLKVVFAEPHLKVILDYLDAKVDKTEEYIATVEEFKAALAASQV
ncbi:MAG: hypothetical protein M0P13_08070 [Fibrobacteraceae bacterium]|nr:hypothetical protein [Fibrobacteraceae bacterium]